MERAPRLQPEHKLHYNTQVTDMLTWHDIKHTSLGTFVSRQDNKYEIEPTAGVVN